MSSNKILLEVRDLLVVVKASLALKDSKSNSEIKVEREALETSFQSLKKCLVLMESKDKAQ